MYAVEMSDAPDFRRNIEDMHYSQAPSRFGVNTAYVEVGWSFAFLTHPNQIQMYAEVHVQYV